MPLELSSLRKAIESLERSLAWGDLSFLSPSSRDALVETLRAGVIQNFEVAYEQCWKMMKRWIEMNVSTDIVEGVSRRELYRRAAEERLIDEVDRWMAFHSIRNLTSHTYDVGTAKEAFEAAEAFLPFARDFLSRIENRVD